MNLRSLLHAALLTMAVTAPAAAAQTILRDDFDRPDGSGLGPSWSGGVFWSISGGTAVHSDALGDDVVSVASSGAASYTIELRAKVLASSSGPSGSDEFGVIAGYTAARAGSYRLSYSLVSQSLSLIRRTDDFSVLEVLASAPLPAATTFQRWKLARSADGTFRVFVDQGGGYPATPLLQATDATYPTLGQFGFFAANEAPAQTAVDWIEARDDAATVDFRAAINFQPAGRPLPAGYLADTGAAYGARNGLTYGWNRDTASATRDRGALADQRFDTLVHLQQAANPDARWEIAVPNGSYTVRVVAGDPSYIDSRYRIAVEGVIAVDGTPTSSARFIDRTVTVTVSDGRLTVGNATGARNNKLAFIEIESVPVAPTANG